MHRRHRHDVFAGREIGEPVDAPVIGLRGATRRGEHATTRDQIPPKRTDLHADDRLAGFVDDHSGDRGRTEHPDHHVALALVVRELEALRLAAWTEPSERAFEIAGLLGRERKRAFRQITKRKSSFAIGHHARHLIRSAAAEIDPARAGHDDPRSGGRAAGHIERAADRDDRPGDRPVAHGVDHLADEHAAAGLLNRQHRRAASDGSRGGDDLHAGRHLLCVEHRGSHRRRGKGAEQCGFECHGSLRPGLESRAVEIDTQLDCTGATRCSRRGVK